MNYNYFQILCHNLYNPSNFDNDICVLKVYPDIVYNREVGPICLPIAGQTYADGSPVTVTGWGHTTHS